MEEGFYPVRERLVEGADEGEGDVFLVDVGGSTGHDLVRFRAAHPVVPGKLVLQDLLSVIEGVKKDEIGEGVVAMGHDFFTEQPVKGMAVINHISILRVK